MASVITTGITDASNISYEIPSGCLVLLHRLRYHKLIYGDVCYLEL